MSYEKYAKLRDERGFTDYRVSQETGVSTATLTSWKQGVYEPKVEKKKRIAEFLKVGIEELI